MGKIHGILAPVVGKTFFNTTVSIDGKYFIGCNFLYCKLHLQYGHYRMTDCFSNYCSLLLEPPALGVAVFLKAHYGDEPITFIEPNLVMRNVRREP